MCTPQQRMDDLDRRLAAFRERYAKGKADLLARLKAHLGAGLRVREGGGGWWMDWGRDVRCGDGAPVQYASDTDAMAEHLMNRHFGFGFELVFLGGIG